MQAQAADDAPQAPRGPHFTKLYAKGTAALKGLLATSPTAAQLYLFLVEQCGHDNAVVCTYATLADELEMSERTIRRAVRLLEERQHVVIAKMGTANAYILNPQEVWKTYEDHKRFCAFSARALVSKTENGNLRQRLTHLRNRQTDMELDQPAKPRKKAA